MRKKVSLICEMKFSECKGNCGNRNYSFAQFWYLGPQRRGRDPAFKYQVFAQITPKECLEFRFTPSKPYYSGCQIDLSRNKANFHIQFSFSRLEICPITPSCFPLEGAGIENQLCAPKLNLPYTGVLGYSFTLQNLIVKGEEKYFYNIFQLNL